MKFLDCVKFGFGFFIGYTIAKELDKQLGIIYTDIKKRVKEGY